jgi:ABC-type ATPase with predicted acetyltransferase domain
VTLLWHGDKPIGICVFCVPAVSLAPRNRFFGLRGNRTSLALKNLNRSLVVLSRVVIHPIYRGAGVAAAFIRRSCATCPWPWIETLTEMGHLNPFFERAGFVRVGLTSAPAGRARNRRQYSALYGRRRTAAGMAMVTEETFRKSRFAQPVYYIFDNRGK